MKHKSIASLLRTRLSTLSGLPPVANENVGFRPIVTEAYLREACLFGDAFNLGLASSSASRQDGLYQVDVLVPKNTTKYKALEYCDLLVEGFARQARAFVDGNTVINLEGSTVSPSRIENEMFVYSVSVRFTAVE